MEMVERVCEELLMDAMVPTRRQVVILAIPGFFLFKVRIKKDQLHARSSQPRRNLALA
jgi:hypothetical protein